MPPVSLRNCVPLGTICEVNDMRKPVFVLATFDGWLDWYLASDLAHGAKVYPCTCEGAPYCRFDYL